MLQDARELMAICFDLVFSQMKIRQLRDVADLIGGEGFHVVRVAGVSRRVMSGQAPRLRGAELSTVGWKAGCLKNQRAGQNAVPWLLRNAFESNKRTRLRVGSRGSGFRRMCHRFDTPEMRHLESQHLLSASCSVRLRRACGDVSERSIIYRVPGRYPKIERGLPKADLCRRLSLQSQSARPANPVGAR